MELPSDVKQSLDRMKNVAVVDELRRVTQVLQRNEQTFAAQLVANRADNLSKAIREKTHA
ncbi:hypothetical protein [Vreelandella alkaliphila]|uniref:Uncharacterized protein n=1 Tax=Vreelandella alkaliphila TaxID=272774 RepID=A0AAJ2S2H6_9GAMM|nr:hypothetical protein [Halomonas alkaliphila]MDX5979597.1 hypothetical protein [Halomonas alkaliphila]